MPQGEWGDVARVSGRGRALFPPMHCKNFGYDFHIFGRIRIREVNSLSGPPIWLGLRRVRTGGIVSAPSWLTQEAASSARNLGNSRSPVWPRSEWLPMRSGDRGSA